MKHAHKPTINYTPEGFTRDGAPVSDAFAKLLWGNANHHWTEEAYIEASSRFDKKSGCMPLMVVLFALAAIFLCS